MGLFASFSVWIQLLTLSFFFQASLFVLAGTTGWKRQGQVVEAGRDGGTRRFPGRARRNGGGSAAGRSNLAALIVYFRSDKMLIFSVYSCLLSVTYRWFSLYQVCANLMEYCQTLLLQSSAQAQFSICLFSPSASEPAGRDGGRAGQSDWAQIREERRRCDVSRSNEWKGKSFSQGLIIRFYPAIAALIMRITCVSIIWWFFFFFFFRNVICSACDGVLLGPHPRSGPVPSEKQRFGFLPFPPESQTKSEQASEPGAAATWGAQGGNHDNRLTLPHTVCCFTQRNINSREIFKSFYHARA